MEEKKVTLSFSTDRRSEYCLQILGDLVVEYRITNEEVYERITCDTNDYSIVLMTKKENDEFYKEIDLSALVENDVVDISNRGDRWEGSTLNGKPFGYGCIFNENDSLYYRGFLVDDQKVCWGTTFYKDCNVVEYSGCYYDGMKHGYGVLYDRKGNLLYDGFFLCDNADYSKSVRIDSSTIGFGQIHNLIEDLRIGPNSMKNEKSAVFRRYPFLKLLDIGDQNYQNTRVFCVIECDSLKTIIIRKWCFTCYNSMFKVISCLCLNTIQIGYHSFQNCSMVIIKSLNSKLILFRLSILEIDDLREVCIYGR